MVSPKVMQVVKKVVPPAIYQPIVAWWRRPRPVRWGDLRRFTPINPVFGLRRGQPVDRYYIEAFLRKNSSDIYGRVMEIGDDTYTRKFGGEHVTKHSN